MNDSISHCNYLCINSGSSSLKISLYRVDQNKNDQKLYEISARGIGEEVSYIASQDNNDHLPIPNHESALTHLLDMLPRNPFDAIGHRVVHGGEKHTPTIISPELIKQLEGLAPLAPLHIPPALLCIKHMAQRWPHKTQVACFDTAFHHTLPEIAYTLALPVRYRERGIRKYGFHGLSYEYIVHKLKEKSKGRLIIAHLGNGTSLSALQDGRSIDTTMGLTPTGGVMMGTRTGDLDPGVLFYLQRSENMSIADMEQIINHESGLLGISGITSDMVTLLGDNTPAARLAVTMYANHIRKAIGALTTTLGGIDRLVFTGGIGEHAA
ncbi:acetate/propionate family kinase, partial [Acidihalobacter prosperus]